MKKRFLSCLLILCMVFSLLPVSALATTDVEVTLGRTKLGVIERNLEMNTGISGYKDTTQQLAPESVTLPVGQQGSFQRLPTTIINNVQYSPKSYGVIRGRCVDVSDPDVVGDFQYSLEYYTGTNYPCLQFNYTAKQAGTARITLEFFYNFGFNPSEAPSIGNTWWRQTKTINVTVTDSATEPEKPEKPTVSDIERFHNNVNTPSSSEEGAVYMWCGDSLYDHGAWFSYLTDVEGGYSLGEVVANTESNAASYPWVCPMTVYGDKYLAAYNSEPGFTRHWLEDGEPVSQTVNWYYSAGDGMWKFKSTKAPIYFNITHDNPYREPTTADFADQAILVKCDTDDSHSAQLRYSDGTYTINWTGDDRCTLTFDVDSYVATYAQTHEGHTAVEGQTVTKGFSYSNGEWKADDTPRPEIHVVCNEPEEKPALPTVEKVGRTGFNMECRSTDVQHNTTNYSPYHEIRRLQLTLDSHPNAYRIISDEAQLGTDPNGKARYYFKVEVDVTAYIEDFDYHTGREHTLCSDQSETLTLTFWLYDSGSWNQWRAATAYVQCAETDVPPVPTKERFYDFTYAIDCVDDASHSTNVRLGNSFGYDKTVYQDEEGHYIQLVIDAESYIRSYNRSQQAAGRTHVRTGDQPASVTAKIYYDKENNRWPVAGTVTTIRVSCIQPPTADEIRQALNVEEPSVTVKCVTSKPAAHEEKSYAPVVGLPANAQAGERVDWFGQTGYLVELDTAAFVNAYAAEEGIGEHSAKTGTPDTLTWVVYWNRAASDNGTWMAEPYEMDDASAAKNSVIEVTHKKPADVHLRIYKSSDLSKAVKDVRYPCSLVEGNTLDLSEIDIAKIYAGEYVIDAGWYDDYRFGLYKDYLAGKRDTKPADMTELEINGNWQNLHLVITDTHKVVYFGSAEDLAAYQNNHDASLIVSSTRARVGAALPTADAPTVEREGYTFKFWSREGQSTDVTGQTVSGWTNLYANWEINQYTITFMVDGQEYAKITQDYGTVITAPEAPTKTGYIFEGWDAEIPETMPANNLVLTAQWRAATYTVAYHGNGGVLSGNPDGDKTTSTGTIGQPLTLKNSNTFVREHYDFLGWSTDPNATTAEYAGSQILAEGYPNAEAGVTYDLYAVWAKHAYTVAINACLNGEHLGWISNVNVTVGENLLDAVKGELERVHASKNKTMLAIWEEGRTDIVGYHADLTKLYSDKKPTEITGDALIFDSTTTQVYINYLPNPDTHYKVKHVLETLDPRHPWETNDTDELTGETGTTVTATPRTKYKGFTFDKDNENNVLSGVIKGDGSLVLSVYYIRNIYNVTFDLNGGNVNGSADSIDVAVKYGATLNADQIPSPSRDGYDFAGWYTTADGEAEADLTAPVEGNCTVYAKWTARNDTPYTIRYFTENLDGSWAEDEPYHGKGTTDTTIVATEVNEKSYEDFTLDLTVAGTVSEGVIAGDGSLVLKLYFTRNTYNYEVRHIKQLSDGSYDEEHAEVETLSGRFEEIATVNAKDYGPHYPSNDAASKQNIKIAKNLVIEVRYDLDTHTLRFDSNGGSAVSPAEVTVLCGAQVVDGPLLPPIKDGYDFAGWYDDTEGKIPHDFMQGLTEDKTVYAGWTEAKPVDTHHWLTINYVFDNGKTAADPVVLVLEEGKSYAVESPVIYRYAADRLVVKGTMPGHDVTETVVYTRVYTPGGKTDETNTLKFNTKDHFAYINGYPDGTVNPEGNVTRAEVAAILYRIMDNDCVKKYESTRSSFADVNRGDWYNTYVATLENAGVIVDTRMGGSFRPNEAITRAELAAMLAQFADIKSATNSFNDVPAKHWAADEIAVCAKMGWINGYPDGSFRPDATITRAEMMAMINRALGRTPWSESDLLPGMKTWSDNANVGAWYYLDVQEATNGHTYTKSGDHETWKKLR